MNALDNADAGDRTPSEIFGDLFAAVAMADIMPAKDWADATPRSSPAHILQAFRVRCPETPEALLAFVGEWFDRPAPVAATLRAATLDAHIEATWRALVRTPLASGAMDSLLPLPGQSLAPGGRFRECYYWDTYFTLLGLRHRPDLVRASAENFRWQIGQYGFAPNANRTYYLSRSQPPLLFKIVELLAELEGPHIIAEFLPALIGEHRFWMNGDAGLPAGGACRRVVKLPDGTLLNRYWDDRAAPRDESWRTDIITACAAPTREPEEVYRDIRAACESGWDFSSRWLANADDLSTIITTAIAPVDLNSILYGLERFIAAGLAEQGEPAGAGKYAALADRRGEGIRRHLWDGSRKAFSDLDWKTGCPRDTISAAVAAPLFFGVADAQQASATALLIHNHLLAPGGLLTTTRSSDLQWDSPNGWAPLQWMASEGLAAYGFGCTAEEIRTRWLATVERVFQKTGRVFEKYDVMTQEQGGGGEYAVQDGFGWTNGVTAAFLEYARSRDNDRVSVAPRLVFGGE